MFKCFIFLVITVAIVAVTAQTRQTRAIGEACSARDPTSKCPKHSSCFSLNCIDSVCICLEGYWPSKDFTECLPAVRLGGTCTPSQASCLGRPPNSMTCRNSQCSCADGYAPTDDGMRCGQYFAGFGMSVVKMSRLSDTCDNKTRKCAHGLECRPYAKNSPISTCQCAPGFRPRSTLEDRVRFNTIEDCFPLSYSLGCPTTSTSSSTTTTAKTSTSTTAQSTASTRTAAASSRPLPATTIAAAAITTKRPHYTEIVATTMAITTPRKTTTQEITKAPSPSFTSFSTSSSTKTAPFSSTIKPSTMTTSTIKIISSSSTGIITSTTAAPSTTVPTPPTTSTTATTQSTTTTTSTRRTTTTNILDTVTLNTISVAREPLVLPIDLIVPAAVVAACCLLAGVLGVACACVRRYSHFTDKKGSGPGTMSAVATAIGSGASSEIIDGSANGRQQWAGAILSPDRNVSPDIGGDFSSPGLGMDDGRTEDILMSEPPNTSRAAAVFSNFAELNSPSGMTMVQDTMAAGNNNVVPALVPPLPSRHYHQQTYIANAAASIATTRNSIHQAPVPPPPPLPARPNYGTSQRPSQSSVNNNNNGGGYFTNSRNPQQNAFSSSPPLTVVANRSLGQQSQQVLISHQQLRSMRANNSNR